MDTDKFVSQKTRRCYKIDNYSSMTRQVPLGWCTRNGKSGSVSAVSLRESGTSVRLEQRFGSINNVRLA